MLRLLALSLLLLAACASCVRAPAALNPQPAATAETPRSIPATSPALALRATWEALDPNSPRESFNWAMGALNGILTESEPDSFAGLWILPTSPERAAVAFTKAGAETLQPYLEGLPYADRIEVRTAEHSLQALQQTKLDLFQRVTDLGFEAIASTDVPTNRVVIEVLAREEVLAALEREGITLPPYVEFVEIEGMVTPEG